MAKWIKYIALKALPDKAILWSVFSLHYEIYAAASSTKAFEIRINLHIGLSLADIL